MQMHKVVLCNAFSLSMLSSTEATIHVKEVDIKEVRKLLAEGFESAIGHESTANVLKQLLGVEVKAERRQVVLTPDNVLLVFQLLSRLPEGKILTEEELLKMNYKFYLVEVLET
jgi:hypothetical protein